MSAPEKTPTPARPDCTRRRMLQLAGASLAPGMLHAVQAQTPLSPSLPLSTASSSSPLAVVYPNLNGNSTNNLGYRMLALALSRAGKPYTLTLHPVPVNDERARAMLRTGEVSVVDFGSGAEFENAFSAIYFPIDRGLLGYRIGLIHQDLRRDFSRVNTLPQLRRYRAGQGLGWSNNVIMQTAGIPVVTGPTLDALFPMLEAKRFDYLPLGLNEVYGFADQYQRSAPSMVVDEHVLLVYRFARMFYVRTGNEILRATVLRGLQQAFTDGSLQKLLNNDPSVRRAVLRAKLAQRATITIDNPLLTPAFLNMPDAYYFQASEFK